MIYGNTRRIKHVLGEVILCLLFIMLFLVPFYFMIINAGKSSAQAAEMNLLIPDAFQYLENFARVFGARDYMLVRAFKNSALITAFSIGVIIFVSSAMGYILQRRKDAYTQTMNVIMLTGLMIPPAIVPTIWVLQNIGLYKTLEGMVLIEVALNVSYACTLYRAFTKTIPIEIDEAAVIDGCGCWRLFAEIVFPLLKPVTYSIIVILAIQIYNDFVNPLYFLPGAKNATVQLTMYNFTTDFANDWNLIFANALCITIPTFVLYICFNKRIVSGMVAGAVKG